MYIHRTCDLVTIQVFLRQQITLKKRINNGKIQLTVRTEAVPWHTISGVVWLVPPTTPTGGYYNVRRDEIDFLIIVLKMTKNRETKKN